MGRAGEWMIPKSEMDEIRVLLVDDHPTLRVGLGVLLEQAGISVIGETGSGREALEQIEARRPDVIVLDCQLPDVEGTAVAMEIKRRGLPTRVLALSSYSDARYVRAMIDAGAAGYLLKDEAPERIVEAVRAAANGKSLWTAEQVLRAQRWQEEIKDRWAQLTTREREVLMLVAQGKTNKEIGKTLGISEKAVEKYMSEIFATLNVSSRAAAAVWAVREGLG
jgi:DNA-binding NarL/FixJ family response regulator